MAAQAIFGTHPLTGNWNGHDSRPFIYTSGNTLFGLKAGIIRMPTSGTIRNLLVVLSGAFGSGTSGTFRFQKGGANQAVTVTIADLATTGQDITNSFTVAENDELTIDLVRTGVTANVTVWYSFEFEPDTAGHTVYATCGDLSSFRLGGTAYNLFGSTIWGSNVAEKAARASMNSTFTKMKVIMTHAPGAGQSWTFNLVVNGVVQDGTGGTVNTTTVVSGTATTADGSFSLSVTEHDRISIRAVASATCAAQFSTNVALLSEGPEGEQHLSSGEITPPSSGTSYAYPLGGGVTGVAFVATESQREFIGPQTSLIITDLTVYHEGDAGTQVIYTLRINGTATGLTVTLGATDRVATIAGSVELGPGDTWAMQAVASDNVQSVARSNWVFALGSAPAAVIQGSAVFGVNTTVTVTRAIAMGLDGNTNVHNTVGQHKVFGDMHVTGTLEVGGNLTGGSAALDGMGE